MRTNYLTLLMVKESFIKEATSGLRNIPEKEVDQMEKKLIIYPSPKLTNDNSPKILIYNMCVLY